MRVLSEQNPAPHAGPLERRRPGREEWRYRIGLLIVACIAVLGLFWPTVRTMLQVWTHSRTFAHGLLVFPACLYLIWCSRARLSGLAPAWWGYGWLLLAASMGGWIVASLADIMAGREVAVLLMFPALVGAILGSDVLRALGYPLGFLLFALPIGTSIEPWLQESTAVFIMVGLKLTGIQAVRDGYFITVQPVTWEVAPDCGGLRYVLPGLALGYMYTAVMYRHWRRLGFLVLCVFALMVANGLRAYAIITTNYLGIAEGADHRVFSYIIYGVTMASLFWIGLKWKKPAQDQGPREKAGNRAHADGTAFTVRTGLGLFSCAHLAIPLLSIQA